MTGNNNDVNFSPFVKLHSQVQDIGFEIVSSIRLLTPDIVIAYITDTLYLIAQVVGMSDAQFFQYIKVASGLQEKYPPFIS